MESHVKIVAVLHIVFGGIGLLMGLFVAMMLGGMAVFIGVAEPNDGWIASSVLSVVAFFMATLTAACSIPGIIGGLGLMGQANWARILIRAVAKSMFGN